MLHVRSIALACTVLALLATAPLAHAQKSRHKKKSEKQSAPKQPAPLSAGSHEVVLNGVRFWYRVAGQPRKGAAPLLFLHGGPGYNSHSFSVLEGPRLERAVQMVYYDQRGAGHSERPWTGHYQLDTLVEDVEVLRRTLGVPKIALMGHSFGGLLALEYAARYPQNVSRMVLVGAFSDGPATCRVHRERVASLHLAEYARLMRDTAWLRAPGRSDCDYEGRAVPAGEQQRFNDSGMFPDPAKQRLQDSVDATSGLRNTGEMSRALLRGGLMSLRFTKHAQVTMPVLVIAGENDYAIGIHSQRSLAALLPEGRLAEYPRAGHFPYLDEPERFARDVISFLTADLER